MQIIKMMSYYFRAEILLGEKEETREELVKELRRLVHMEDNLSVPQVVSQESFFICKRELLLLSQTLVHMEDNLSVPQVVTTILYKRKLFLLSPIL